ncbi:hypothetical protein LNQ03_33340 [Klebsiella pneumoniae subsp. pneumoniae]|nr:hypothetical protein [Klebsiella pneumoniae subsp. pneumoniae]
MFPARPPAGGRRRWSAGAPLLAGWRASAPPQMDASAQFLLLESGGPRPWGAAVRSALWLACGPCEAMAGPHTAGPAGLSRWPTASTGWRCMPWLDGDWWTSQGPSLRCG